MPKTAAATATATRGVVCSVCGKHAEIMAPAEGFGTVEWVCPAPTDTGELCGALNTTTG